MTTFICQFLVIDYTFNISNAVEETCLEHYGLVSYLIQLTFVFRRCKYIHNACICYTKILKSAALKLVAKKRVGDWRIINGIVMFLEECEKWAASLWTPWTHKVTYTSLLKITSFNKDVFNSHKNIFVSVFKKYQISKEILDCTHDISS